MPERRQASQKVVGLAVEPCAAGRVGVAFGLRALAFLEDAGCEVELIADRVGDLGRAVAVLQRRRQPGLAVLAAQVVERPDGAVQVRTEHCQRPLADRRIVDD